MRCGGGIYDLGDLLEINQGAVFLTVERRGDGLGFQTLGSAGGDDRPQVEGLL